MGVFDNMLKDIAADAIAKVSTNKTWSEGKYQNTPKMVGAGYARPFQQEDYQFQFGPYEGPTYTWDNSPFELYMNNRWQRVPLKSPMPGLFPIDPNTGTSGYGAYYGNDFTDPMKAVSLGKAAASYLFNNGTEAQRAAGNNQL